MKYCPTCKQNKSENEFGPNAARHDKLSSHCKICAKILVNKYRKTINNNRNKDYQLNKEKYKEKNNKSYIKNRNKRLLNQKERYNNNKTKYNEESRKYYHLNKERLIEEQLIRDSTPERKARKRELKKQWIKNNRERHRENSRSYINRNPKVKIIRNLRNRIYKILQRSHSNKAGHTVEQLGCTPEFLKQYLESKFYSYVDESGQTIQMSWENFGGGHGKWQVDHIIPLFSFDFSIPNQQRAANHYTNLQPLWFNDHNNKSCIDLRFSEMLSLNSWQPII